MMNVRIHMLFAILAGGMLVGTVRAVNVVVPDAVVASSERGGGVAAENTIGSSGLDRSADIDADTMNANPALWNATRDSNTTTWHSQSSVVISNQWITWSLDEARTVEGLWIWNGVQAGTYTRGVEHYDLTVVNNGETNSIITNGTLAMGTTTGALGQYISFGGFTTDVTAVTLAVNTSYDADYVSISKARFQAGDSIVKETPFNESWQMFRGSLQNSHLKMENDRAARVVFLGGSITHMSGWRDQVMQYLQDRFPSTAFTFVNAGIPSIDSTPNAFRLQRDVFANGTIRDADLVFVDAAVNDHYNMRSELEMKRAMEGIARHARRINPHLDMVFLYFSDPDKNAIYNVSGEVPPVIAAHEVVAAAYDISVVNIAKEVADKIKDGSIT